MTNIYDVIVIGTGVAGVFATYNLSKKYKDAKIAAIEIGRPMFKRRLQCIGYFGLFPNSDGKLYTNDVDKVADLIGSKKSKTAYKSVVSTLNNVSKFKIIKDKSPTVSTLKKLKKLNYDITLNDHIQVYPKDIHALSKYMVKTIETNKNVTFSFDNEVFDITKQKNMFMLTTEQGDFYGKKILLCAGRAGWRWVKEIFDKFGLVEENNFAKYGIKIELDSAYMREINKSNCTISSKDVEIGPFSWNGTVIPEDHVDFTIASFRSNENRWKSDKVSFNFIGNIPAENSGSDQMERMAKLTFILSNDRIVKEKLSSLVNHKSKVCIMKEYAWFSEQLQKFGEICPEMISKAYFHVPVIMPLPPKVNLGNNLSTEVDGLFLAGEAAGVTGLLSAACMGAAVADEILK